MEHFERIKQISCIPDDYMVVSENEETGEYEDLSGYGFFAYISLVDGVKKDLYGKDECCDDDTVKIGIVSEDGLGQIEPIFLSDGYRLIPAHRCPVCRNKMTVLPFKKYSEAVYRCVICGENYPVKL